MRAFYQPFNRCKQPACQREGGQRGKQRRKCDNQPAGLTLLLVEVDIRVARQTFNRGGDHPADRRVIHGDGALCAIRRDGRTRAHEHAHVLVYDPELCAPAVRRHPGAGTIVIGIVLKRAEDLKNKTVVITQKTPVAVQGILIAQRIAQPL